MATVTEERHVVRAGPSRTWYDEAQGIIFVELDPNAVLDIEQARGATVAMNEVGKGIARPLFVDFTNMKSQTKECRDYYSKNPDHIKTYSAIAILISNPLSRVFANFFIGLNKPLKPTRLFDDRAKAIEWLKAQAAST
jgi:hypothetical protein